MIICTYGRGGRRQIVFGSIAQQVVESGRAFLSPHNPNKRRKIP